LIAVRVDIDRERRRARIDFTGTSPQGAHNFNAPRAVCTAAVLYVFRTLIEWPIPLNEGCLEPLEIVIPAGPLLAPRPPAAGAGVRDPPRLGWRRTAPWRRWHRAAAGVSCPVLRSLARQSSPHCALRAAGRTARRPR